MERQGFHCAEHWVNWNYRKEKCGAGALQLLRSGLIWAGVWLCPQPYRSHAFFSGQWRQQVFLTQELQGEVDQQTSDGLQLLYGLLRVGVAEAFLDSVLLQLSHVVHRVEGQTFENLHPEHRRGEKTETYTFQRLGMSFKWDN